MWKLNVCSTSGSSRTLDTYHGSRKIKNHHSDKRDRMVVFTFLACLLFGLNCNSKQGHAFPYHGIAKVYHYRLMWSVSFYKIFYISDFLILSEVIAVSLLEATLSSLKNWKFVIFSWGFKKTNYLTPNTAERCHVLIYHFVVKVYRWRVTVFGITRVL